ncbi:MAG: hypothetical protein KME26_10825 [Oscillatoria princeps RMCB-10]|jgi:glucose-6-phosphate 1-dehydrogenase|nr:hypothetical protein [Oscillatoria princeps RMCB-10]
MLTHFQHPAAITPVIWTQFGFTSNLFQTTLLSILFQLFRQDKFPKGSKILLVSPDPGNTEAARNEVRKILQEKGFGKCFDPQANAQIEDCTNMMEFVCANVSTQEGVQPLQQKIAELDPDGKFNRIFYAALPPVVYLAMLKNLQAAGLLANPETSWVILEKGIKDSESARALLQLVEKICPQQVLLMDHYPLGKATLRLMLALRFGDLAKVFGGVDFEALCGGYAVEYIQVWNTEAKRVGNRPFFDSPESGGLVRDMTPHLLQIPALTLMQRPDCFSSTGIQQAKLDALKALALANPENPARCIALGQYASYLDEEGTKDTRTATGFAAKLIYQSGDAPLALYLLSAKGAAKGACKAVVSFRPITPRLFQSAEPLFVPRFLVLEVQPNPQVSLWYQMGGELIRRHFSYQELYGEPIREAYDYALEACLNRDAALFVTPEDLLQSTQLIETIQSANVPVNIYPFGAVWGTPEMEDLPNKDNRNWINL